MLFLGSIEDGDVVEVYNHKKMSEWLHDIIHHPREHHCHINQVDGHDQPLKSPSLELKVVFHALVGLISTY
jgi:hypothetical protein